MPEQAPFRAATVASLAARHEPERDVAPSAPGARPCVRGPFLFVGDARLALHLSNGVAIVLLYLAGHALGRVSGRPPVRVGLGMVVIGAALVALTIALGG